MLTIATAPSPLVVAAAAAALTIGAASPSALQANGANAVASVSPVAGASVAASGAGASVAARGLADAAATTRALSFQPASGATSIDCSQGNTFGFTLEGAAAFAFARWPTTGRDQRVVVYLAQDATGGRTASFAGVKWPDGAAPELSTSAGAVDCLVFDSFDGGQTIFGNLVGGAYA
jgi:hypothetical protein